MSKCKELEEMAVEQTEKASRGRKRKVGLEEPAAELTTSSIELETRRLDVVSPENSGNSPCESVGSDHVSSSCCLSKRAIELVKGSSKSLDLEETEVTVKLIAIATGEPVDFRDRSGGTSPPSAVHVQSVEQESTARSQGELNSRCRSKASKKPSEAEMEEFFAAIEKNVQEKFIDKYNYDIVKDEPLREGRYEWVQIQPKP